MLDSRKAKQKEKQKNLFVQCHMDLVIKHIYFNKLIRYCTNFKIERENMLHAITHYKWWLLRKGIKGFDLLLRHILNYKEIEASKEQLADNYYVLRLVKKGFISMKASIQYKIDQRQAENEAILLRK